MSTRVLVIALCALAATPGLPSEDPFLGSDGAIFPNPVTPAPGSQRYGLLGGDFNEDGLPDLLSVHASGLTVLLGNGDCSFAVSTVVFPGTGPGAVADFDEDGHLDVAVANSGNGVHVLLGNGDGTFGSPTTFVAPTISNQALSFGLVTGDFDEDNHVDLVLGHYSGAPLAFFAGNGDGTFASGVAFSNDSTRNITAGDFDENDDLDLLSGTPTPRVRLGDGNGGFADAGTVSMGDNPFDVEVFDFDGDTHLDVVTANLNSDDVAVSLGNGNGTFDAATIYPVGEQPGFLTLTDADQDGAMDIVVGYFTQPFLSLLEGTGTGTFAPETRIPTPQETGPSIVADFDGDGLEDIAVAGHNEAELSVFRGLENEPVAGMDTGLVRSDGDAGVLSAAFGDLDNDGLPDAVLLRDDGDQPGIIEVTVRLSAGDGTYPVTDTLSAGSQPTDVAIADVDNDTFADVLVTNFISNQVLVFPGNGDGTLDAASSIPTRDAISIVTGLFDADTDVDLAILATGFGPQARVMLGNGDGTFAFAGAQGVGPNPISVEAGDFNEDGEVDLAVLNGDDADISVLLGVGDGTFSTEIRYGPVSFDSESFLQVVDEDADGHQDLLLARPDGVILRGVGDGTFAAPSSIGLGTASIASGDVNGDGLGDIFSVALPGHLRLRQPDLSLGDPTYHSFERIVRALVIDDVDGDARNDLVAATAVGVTVMLNVEAAAFNFAGGKTTLNWPQIDGAISYNVYRGLISDLTDGDDDGLPDAGYGDCQNALDPDTTDTVYDDASTPPSGDGYFYLIALEDGMGERELGRTADRLPRVPASPCP